MIETNQTNPPELVARFDAICEAVQAAGRGLTFQQLGDAHALAWELENREPDQDRVALLVERLGLENADDLPAEVGDL